MIYFVSTLYLSLKVYYFSSLAIVLITCQILITLTIFFNFFCHIKTKQKILFSSVIFFTSLTHIREANRAKITLRGFFRISCFRLCRFRKIRSFISVSLCLSVCLPVDAITQNLVDGGKLYFVGS